MGKRSFDASRNRLFSIRGETANEALLEEVATPRYGDCYYFAKVGLMKIFCLVWQCTISEITRLLCCDICTCPDCICMGGLHGI